MKLYQEKTSIYTSLIYKGLHMTGSQNWDKNEEEIVVEVYYYPQYNQVSVVANDQGIQYLIDTLEAVRRSQRSGYHYHLDKATNRIDGNVTDLVLEKK